MSKDPSDPKQYSGKLADPEFRRKRASNAALSRNSPDHLLSRIRELVVLSRAEQGLPPVVVDDLTLKNVADLLTAGRNDTP